MNRHGEWLSDIVCDDTSYDNRRDFTTFSGESHSTCGFSDVSSTDWYVMSGTLETVIEKDIMHGYSDGRFGGSGRRHPQAAAFALTSDISVYVQNVKITINLSLSVD